ncbi:hypothetical protein A3Q56_06827 [Intoshia linei]|uniref:Uncharacterized protein n=1 Tax=Intoshia linei TaxID=1819745 RepID=A0A177ATV0_9BILA|nr:hypothetical protein A3Q56_06827 [Intoshia linei]
MEKIYSFGECSEGQLGIGKTDDGIQYIPSEIFKLTNKKIIQITSGCSHTLFLTENGSIYSCGGNDYGQLGYITDKENTDENYTPNIIEYFDSIKVTMIACGSYHSAALSKKGRVYTWGMNDHGQLGINDSISFISSPREKDFLINDKIKLIKLFDEYSNRSQKYLATKHSISVGLINKSLKNREEILNCNNLNLNQKRKPCLRKSMKIESVVSTSTDIKYKYNWQYIERNGAGNCQSFEFERF